MDRKISVAVLVERGPGGRARATVVSHPLRNVLKQNIAAKVKQGTQMHTDQHKAYRGVHRITGATHRFVNHGAGEYARDGVHSNTAESWNALRERSIVGAFHHVSPEHLPRYCDEVAFRWDRREIDDTARTNELALME